MFDQNLDFQIPPTRAGAVAYKVIDNFISLSTAEAISTEIDLYQSLSIKPDTVVDNGSRLNFHRGGDGYASLLSTAPKLSMLAEKLSSLSFFNAVIGANNTTLAEKGLHKNTIKFDPDYSGFGVKDKKHHKARDELLHSRKDIDDLAEMHLVIGTSMSTASKGYHRACYTNNRNKALVGLIYFNDVDDTVEGGTGFCNRQETTTYDQFVRLTEEQSINLGRMVDARASRLVLFVNSNDAHHSSEEYLS